MGNTTSQTQNQSAIAQVPSWLQGYFQTGSNQLQSAQANLPNLTNLYNQIPLLNVPGLTGMESNLINQFGQNIGPNRGYNQGMAGLNAAMLTGPAYKQAKQGLESFIGTAGQPSTATTAALKEFKDLQAPEIMQQAALMGQGTSGAGLSALAQGQEQALVPFMQQDLQNQLAASGQLGQLTQAEQGLRGNIAAQEAQLGLGQQAQTQQQLMNALQAAGLPREVAMQQAQALFNQQQQKQQFATNIQQGPMQFFSNLIGQLQNAKSSTTSPKF